MKKEQNPKYETPQIYWFERGGNCRQKPCFTHCGSPQIREGVEGNQMKMNRTKNYL